MPYEVRQQKRLGKVSKGMTMEATDKSAPVSATATPRTDEVWESCLHLGDAYRAADRLFDHARLLERELAEARNAALEEAILVAKKKSPPAAYTNVDDEDYEFYCGYRQAKRDVVVELDALKNAAPQATESPSASGVESPSDSRPAAAAPPTDATGSHLITRDAGTERSD